MKKAVRILCCVLVLCLACNFVMAPKAEAVAATIVVGGVLVVTLGVVAALSLIAANSAGYSPYIKAAADASSMSLGNWMEAAWRQWLAGTLGQLSVVLQIFRDGVTVVKNTGEIIYNAAASGIMSQFLQWLWSADGGGLADISIPGTSGALSPPLDNTTNLNFTGISSIYGSAEIPTGKIYNSKLRVSYANNTDTVMAAWVLDSNSVYYLIFGSKESFRVSITGPVSYSSLGAKYIPEQDMYYYYTSFSSSGAVTDMTPVLNVLSIPVGIDQQRAISYLLVYGEVFGEDNVNTGVFDLPEGKDTNIQDPLDGLDMGQDVIGATVDVSEYLRAVYEAYYEGTTTVTGTLDGETVTGTLEGTGADVIEVVQTGTWEGVGEGEAVGTQTGSPTLDSFNLDLKTFFPFCLPFDLLDMFKLFQAAGEAPDIEFQLDFGRYGGTQTIELDLSSFDGVASILRTMELIAFGAFLAWETKKLLFGS